MSSEDRPPDARARRRRILRTVAIAAILWLVGPWIDRLAILAPLKHANESVTAGLRAFDPWLVGSSFSDRYARCGYDWRFTCLCRQPLVPSPSLMPGQGLPLDRPRLSGDRLLESSRLVPKLVNEPDCLDAQPLWPFGRIDVPIVPVVMHLAFGLFDAISHTAAAMTRAGPLATAAAVLALAMVALAFWGLGTASGKSGLVIFLWFVVVGPLFASLLLGAMRWLLIGLTLLFGKVLGMLGQVVIVVREAWRLWESYENAAKVGSGAEWLRGRLRKGTPTPPSARA